MKKFKKLVIILAIPLILNSLCNKVYANGVDDSIINMDIRSRNVLVGELIHAIVNNKQQFLYDNTTLFDNTAYDKIKDYIQNNFIKGDIGEVVVDYVESSKSSTGDHVLMVNTKIWYDEQSYNKIYLFELHINSDGDIYGYNVWAY